MRPRYAQIMPVEALISIDEYLNTSYDPAMEYIDGVLVERKAGDYLHSLIQSNLIAALRGGYPHLRTLPTLLSRTAETRYQLPDVWVLLTPPPTRHLIDAAFIAIEILSEDDRMTRMMEKLEEDDRKGVPNIWVIDPRLRTMKAQSSPWTAASN